MSSWFEYVIAPPNYTQSEHPADLLERRDTLPTAKELAKQLGPGSIIFRLRCTPKNDMVVRKVDMMWEATLV